MIALALALACHGPADEDHLALAEVDRVSGDPESGHGHALAWVGSELAIGEPFAAPGRVRRADGTDWVVGQGQDLLGVGLAGGEALVVGAPLAAGGGRVEILGTAALAGGGVGWSPVRHGDAVAALGEGGCVQVSAGGEGWCAGERLWSLVSADLDGDGTPTLVAGLARGGLAWRGGVLEPPPGSAEVGRGLAACDLDGDGDDDLLVGAPTPGAVWIFHTDALPVDLEAPDRVIVGEGRFGHAVACRGGEIWVGAPEAGPDRRGALHLVRGQASARVEGEHPGDRLGAAMAPGPVHVAVAAAGTGDVWVLRVE